MSRKKNKIDLINNTRIWQSFNEDALKLSNSPIRIGDIILDYNKSTRVLRLIQQTSEDDSLPLIENVIELKDINHIGKTAIAFSNMDGEINLVNLKSLHILKNTFKVTICGLLIDPKYYTATFEKDPEIISDDSEVLVDLKINHTLAYNAEVCIG